MSYKLNRTNGTLLVELQDGVIDTTSSDLTLVGRNYKGFGEYLNENYIKLLENFSATSAPTNPISGQLWWDTTDQRLKVYDGQSFKVAGGPIVSASQPNNLVAGDLWVDNEQNKLYFFDGTDLVLVGPNYSAVQGKTGYEAVTMIDTSGQTRAVLAQYIGGTVIGIHSKVQFTPRSQDVLAPFAPNRELLVGFNPLYPTTSGDNIAYKWQGTALTAENLVDDQGNSYSNIDFVRTNERDTDNNVVDQEMEAGLFVKGLSGLQVGFGDTLYGTFKTLDSDTKTVIDLEQQNKNFAIRRKVGNNKIDALTFDAINSRFGIFQDTPTVEFDITGSARITGDLEIEGGITIAGASTIVESSTLRIQDPQIQLGIADDSTELEDSQIDGGGFVVNSSNGSKDFIWKYSTGNFTSNQNIDLDLGKEYRINNTSIVSTTTLGNTVVNSSLTNVGTLTSLTVSGNTQVGSISSLGSLNITTGGQISINSQKITGVSDPTVAADVTNKGYVDNAIAIEPISLMLDITGFSSPDAAGTNSGPIADVKTVLDDIYPVIEANNGKVARIHCTSYAASTVSGIDISVGVSPDATKVLQKSSIDVDKAGTENATVIQDIAATNQASGTVTLIPTRYNMIFTVAGGVWTHTSTSNYP